MYLQRTLKLTDIETFRFIELYEMEPILYNSTLEVYRDRDLRAAAAKRISDALNVPGFGPTEVIVKFKNLRSSYCQELKKIAKSRRSGKAGDEVYKPKVMWFAKMNAFIRHFVHQRETQSNEVHQMTGGNFINQVQRCTKLEIMENQAWDEETREHAATPTYSSPETSQHTPLNLKRTLLASSESTPAADKKDMYECFGRYVAAMLRTIGPPDSMLLQQQITTLMTNRMCEERRPRTWSEARTFEED